MATADDGATDDAGAALRARRRRRIRTLAIVAAALLLVVAGSWHILFFWAKSSGRLEQALARRPDRFQIRWTELDSSWPFRFEATGLVIDVRSRRVRWELAAERARFTIDPLALLRRELVVRDARVEDARFHSLSEPTVAGSRLPSPAFRRKGSGAHRPTIAPFAGRPAPHLRARSEPWSWIVDDLEVAALRELWIDDLRLTGELSGRFSLALRRREWAEVAPSRLAIAGGQLALDGAPFARGVDGELELQLLPWRYRGAKFDLIGANAQGRARLRAEIEPAPAVRYLFGARDWLALGARTSPIEADLVVDRGRLRSGSRFAATLVEPSFAAFGFRVGGRATLAATVAGERDREELASRIALDGWTMTRGDATPLFRGDGLTVDAFADAPRLDQLPAAGRLEIDLGRGRAEDLRFVNQLLPAAAGLEIDRGALNLGGHLAFDASDRSGSGRISIAGERLKLTARGQRLAADLALELALADPDLASGSFAVDGSTLRLRNVGAETSAGGSFADWWAETTIARGRVRLREPWTFEGELSARFADTRPVIAFYELKKDLPNWVEKALLFDDVTLTGRAAASEQRIVATELRIPFANGEARADLDLTRELRRARMLLSWRKLDLGIELDGARRQLHLRRAREWFEARQPALR